MTRIFLDVNIYDKLRDDAEARSHLADGVEGGGVAVVTTPVVANEMKHSPFSGFPPFFPVRIEPEAVVVLGHARLGMARLGSGKVFKAHRGGSKKTKDAI